MVSTPRMLGLVLAVNVVASPSPSSGSAVRFLPDNEPWACRAILPACFTRAAWRDLCALDPVVLKSHPEACRQALELPIQ